MADRTVGATPDADTDVVWIATGRNGGGTGPRTFHLSPDCDHIDRSPSVPRGVRRDRIPEHWTVCKACAGAVTPAAVEQDKSYQEALKQAAAENAEGAE